MATPSPVVLIEPCARSLSIEWTPARIRAAEMLADGGNLTLAADLCDAVLGDEAVQGGLKNTVQALLGLPLTFEAGQGRKRRAAVKALEAEEDWWASFPEEQLAQTIRWAVLLGVVPVQLVWTERDGRAIAEAKVWHPRNLRWDPAKRAWFIRHGDGYQETEITPGDGQWLLFTPYGSSRPWMQGAWRACGRWWLLKSYAFRDWGTYSSRQGQGIFVGFAPEAAKKEDRDALARDLQGFAGKTAIALAPGYDFKLVESTAKSYETFTTQIEAANKGITVAVTGLNVTNEEGGSFAKAESLGGIRREIIGALAASLSTTTHDGYLAYWAEFNFGTKDAAPWPMWDATPPADAKLLGESFAALGAGIKSLKDAGVQVDIVALAEAAGVPVDEASGSKDIGQLFQYHLTFGCVTVNEVRARLGLEPIAGGDVPPVPTQSAPAEDGAAKAIDLETVDRLGVDLGIERTVDRVRAVNPPHVQGQIYADALADEAKGYAARATAGFLGDLQDAIAGAKDYPDLRKKIATLYKGASPADLAEVTERALILADLSGRYSAHLGTKPKG
jgi:phage gp29-like protein